jgi:hypothetical protein
VCANAGVLTDRAPLLSETQNLNWALSINVIGA